MGGAAAAVVSTLSLSGPLVGAAASTSYDTRQRFLSFIGIGNGQLLGIQADGALVWNCDTQWTKAAGAWADGSGTVIGSGWAQFASVMGSMDGSIYALRGDGALFHYRYLVHDLTTGAGTWVTGEQIGTGWNKFPEVIGFGGDFYGRNPDGTIHWSHYDPRTRQWTTTGKLLAGFDFRGTELFADASGVLYGFNGKLRWYRHFNGTWAKGSGWPLTNGLGDLPGHGLHFTGAGTFFRVRVDLPGEPATGQFEALRLTNYLAPGTLPAWTNGGYANTVATGWTVEPWAALQGYPIKPSVAAGDPAPIAVSTSFSIFSWSVLKLGGAQPVPVFPDQSGTGRGGIQILSSDDFLASGCGWTPKIQVDTAGFDSGLYTVRLQGPHGLTRDVPFIVTPGRATPTARIAVVIPTLTHHAYNKWGSHNQYCSDLNGRQRFLNLARPSQEKSISPTGRFEHTLYADVMLLQWLTANGYDFDVYDDIDLHRDPQLLTGYQVTVIGSHSEYWSLAMRQCLSNFLTGGGNVVYAGANGIFEAVDIDLASGVVTYRVSAAQAASLSAATGTPVFVGARNPMASLGYPSSLLLGVSYQGISKAYGSYQVKTASDHPLLAGTGLVTGATFGDEGYNGAASGWETDAVAPGAPGAATPDEIIAHGLNTDGLGADIVYKPTGHGGHVFSASSINFVGALATDPAQSRLFKNAFDLMLAVEPKSFSSLSRSSAGSAPSSTPMQRVAPIPPTSDPELDHH